MIIKAGAKYVRGSPSKIRPVGKLVVGVSPNEAINRLKLIRKKASPLIIKVIKQGVANAKNNLKIEPENLKIVKILVEEGPRMRRYDKSHGARFDRGIIKKKFSHIWVFLEAKNGKES